jgi:hypothetical protein
MVSQVLEPIGMNFLLSIIEKDQIAAKERGYFVICDCVIAECPQIGPFFRDNPDHSTDLVGVLIESAARDFLLAVFVALQLMV